MADLKIQGEVILDSSQAEGALARVDASGKKMATALKKSGEEAEGAVSGIGEAAEPAARKLDTATRSIISSIQRQTAATEAGARGSAQYFETLAKQRGISGDAIKPYIDSLKQAEAAQALASKSLGSMELSAKQTTAALRGVPAQFTDIFVSLQGGQAPLTVLLQQGGQLKDMFGGIGNAARALGGYVLGLVNPYTVAAAAAGGLFLAYRAGASEAEEFNKQLILSGQNAKITAAGMTDIARSVSDASNSITQSGAAEFLTQIAISGKVGEENLKRFTAAALEFEAAGGGAASEVSKAFAELANEPLKASIKFNESMNYLTQSTYDQIKALEEQGRFIDAARIAQEAYATAIEQRTPDLVQNLGYVETAWNAITRAAKDAWDWIKEAGRATDLDRANAQLQNAINTGATEAEIRALEVKRNRLQLVEDVTRSNVQAQQEQNDRTKAGITLADMAAASDGQLASQRRKVAEATAQFSAATKGLAADSAEYRRAEADYLKTVSAIAKAEEEKVKRTKKLTEAEKEAIEQRKRDLDVIKLRNEAVGIEFKKREELAQAQQKQIERRGTEIDRIRQQIAAEQQAAAQIGLTKAEISELAAVRLEDAAATMEQTAAINEQMGDFSGMNAVYREQAKTLRELAAAKRDTAAKQTDLDIEEEQKKFADASIKESARAGEAWEKSLTDSILRGFESGKGIAENFADTLENMFKSMILRPTIQGVVSGGMSLLGLPSAGGPALSSLGGIGNMAGGLGSVGAFGSGILSGISEAALGASFVGPSASLAAGATGAGASLGAGLAAIPGWGWALGGIAALLGSGFGKTPGEQHTGGFFSSAGNTGMDAALAVTGGGGDGGWARDLIKRANPEIEAMVGTVVGSVIESTTAQAKALGMDIAVGIDAGFAANTNGQGKNKNAFGYFDVTINGETVAEYINRTLGEDVTKATAQWTSDMTDAVASWVLGGADVLKAGETSGQALERLATNLSTVNGSFDVLGLRMFEASISGASLASNMVDAFGTLERFSELTGQFYQNYYSDSEKFATSQRLLRDQFAELNKTMPESTRGFRAMVEAAQSAGDSDLLASLLELGPAFYGVASAVEDAFNSISATTAKSVRDIELSVLSSGEKYEYLDREIEGLITQLSTATLPADIERLFNQINASSTQAYGLLSPEQQQKFASEFIDTLYEAEAIAQSRLSVSGTQASTVEAQAQAVQVQMDAATIQREAADGMLNAATVIRQAAEIMQAAARASSGQTTTGTRRNEVAFA